ncbi:MAG: nucleotidyltransferase domain-containing protein [Caulobacteraceae bacterium]|nr:nucleotidyltransferase domain-containing protein [Caulobacteraceae bacterium]
MSPELSVEDIRAAVREWAAGEPLLTEVHLFGSFARGEAGAGSDVDLAIVTQADGRLGPFSTYSTIKSEAVPRLEARLGRTVQIEPLQFAVDVVAPAVARDGIQLWP